MADFYNIYRPKTLAQVVGQESAVRQIQGHLKKGLPHALMFTGPSGTGKSTVARILRKKLKCSDLNYVPVDCATADCMKMAKDIRAYYRTRPWGADQSRVWLLEEVQSLSRAQFAQQGLLQALEDCSETSYFILCTTDPEKVIRAVRTRCVEVKFDPIPPASLQELVSAVAAAEKFKLHRDVGEAVAQNCDGSAREALQLLQKAIAAGSSEQDQLQAVSRGSLKAVAFDLVKELMPYKGNPSWNGVKSKLLALSGEEPEKVRHMVLAAARTTLLKGGPLAEKAAAVVRAFQYNYFDSKQAGLALSCWEVVHGR